MTDAAHLTDDQFLRYQARSLAPEDLLRVDDHVAACDACRDRLYTQAAAGTQIEALWLDLAEHLPYDRIVALAEGGGDDQARAHVSNCARCRDEVDDLRRFREAAAPSSPATRWYVPFAVAAAVVIVAGASYWYAKRTTALPERPSAIGVAQMPAKPAPIVLERAAVLDRLISRRDVLLGANDAQRSFDLLSPQGTTVVSDRPTLRWKSLVGARAYVVAVFDEKFAKVAESPEVRSTEWRPAQALPRDLVLNWQVTALIADDTVRAPVPPAPEARFMVVASDEVSRIDPVDHSRLAVLYSKLGALDDAEREVGLLAASDTTLAATLSAKLQLMRKR